MNEYERTFIASSETFSGFRVNIPLTNVETIDDIITIFKNELHIYPNPTKDMLTIDGNYTSVNIYDVFGKLILSTNEQQTINVRSLSDGLYFINIYTLQGITVKKITIRK